MKIYTIFVQDGLRHRFIDTSWARERAACDRMEQLKRSMRATGFDGAVWIAEMTVEDLEPIEISFDQTPALPASVSIDDI